MKSQDNIVSSSSRTSIFVDMDLSEHSDKIRSYEFENSSQTNKSEPTQKSSPLCTKLNPGESVIKVRYCILNYKQLLCLDFDTLRRAQLTQIRNWSCQLV